jgi:hypothetical protein
VVVPRKQAGAGAVAATIAAGHQVLGARLVVVVGERAGHGKSDMRRQLAAGGAAGRFRQRALCVDKHVHVHVTEYQHAPCMRHGQVWCSFMSKLSDFGKGVEKHQWSS